jgi:Lipid A 3-O-deacylase (PagL)
VLPKFTKGGDTSGTPQGGRGCYLYESAFVFVGPALFSAVHLLFGGMEVGMRHVYRLCRFVGLAAGLFVCLTCSHAAGWDISPDPRLDGYAARAVIGTATSAPIARKANFVPEPCVVHPLSEYLVKLAYGKTFLTSTPLDYATLEVSAPFKRYSMMTPWGPWFSEFQVALLGSYVIYRESDADRAHNRNFRSGYELGGLPKLRFTFPDRSVSLDAYFEGGVGIDYVTETYRNAGSRWNWLLLSGFGLQKSIRGNGIMSLGVQWRHISNANMWGTTNEIHSYNPGTNMIQGLVTFRYPFWEGL